MTVPNVKTKQYASELFQDSLITGIPQIIATRNVTRKVIKIIVLTCAFIGFIYQTSGFLTIFWNYPTVLDIKVEYPTVIESPAFTFCNLNGIKRKEFCKQYPGYCISPPNRDKFCTEFPEICNYNTTLWYPNEDALEFEKSPSDRYLTEFGHLSNKTLRYCRPFTANQGICSLNDSVRTFMPEGNGGYRTCHTIFSNINTEKLNQHSLPVLKMSQSLYQMVFEMEPEEYFRPDRQVGVVVAIHSPNILVNPFSDGFIIKPGNLYSVHLKVVEEKLLPDPYETKCQDYKTMWLARGNRGPLSQEMCVAECLYNASLKLCNCVSSDIMFAHNDRICSHDEFEECFNFDVKECYSNCQQPCEFTDFEYSSQERKIEPVIAPIEYPSTPLNDKAVMFIFLKRPEKIIYSHRPQYEDIEMFSFIGGYIGMWLGISLVAVFDFCESTFLTIIFWIRKKL